MSAHTPHELHDVFPQDAQALHRLKLGSAHFNNVASRYHAVNRAIHRIQSEIEPCDDLYAEDLKRQRLRLLDEVAVMLEDAGQLAHA